MSLAKLARYYFQIDLRSLAVFRVLLGAILLVDCWQRWPDIAAFYTADGVFIGVNRPAGPLSLLQFFRTVEHAQVFFVFAGLCYTLFLVGYRTRLFHALSLVCFVSIVNRNLLVRAGDDSVVGAMLMWTLFLPLGARWSIDAVQRVRTAACDHLSGHHFAALGAVAQIGLIYFCTAMAKSGNTWTDGTAIYYALQLDLFATDFGRSVAHWPAAVLKAMTWGVLAAEFLALPMILSPFGQPWLRRIIVAVLCVLHLGIALTTNLGFFAVKMVATFVLLLREEDWQLAAKLGAGARAFLQRRLPFAARALAPQNAPAAIEAHATASATAAPVASNAPAWIVRLPAYAAQTLAAFIFVVVLIECHNGSIRRRLGTAPIPQFAVARSFVVAGQMLQQWDLFAPDPLRVDGWWVVDGITADGKALDPLTKAAPTFAKPVALAERHDRFWRKYFSRLQLPGNLQYREGFARYLTRTNHRQNSSGQKLAKFQLVYVTERTPPPGTAEPFPLRQVKLLSWDCFMRSGPASPPEPLTAQTQLTIAAPQAGGPQKL